jgi:UDP-N-acetylmuramate--alanine ligase
MKPTVAIVTNIDDEHMNAYRSRRDLEDSFKRFAESIPFYGLAVLCNDDPVVRQIAQQSTRRVLTYGLSEGADLSAVDIEASATGMEFGIVYRGAHLGRCKLPMLGRHLVLNSLAAIAVGLEFGISIDVIKTALAAFGGVKRRLEVVGTVNGITVMNDYGHHPTEIRATLRAIKECFGSTTKRLLVVFQPHRYTRTQLCWNELLTSFSDADHLTISEVYDAGEEPIVGVSGETLLREVVHPSKHFAPQLEALLESLPGQLQDGDLILFLGAGPIGSMPDRLFSILKGEGTPTEQGAESRSTLAELRVVTGGR